MLPDDTDFVIINEREHWISIGNLRKILSQFPDNYRIETNHLADFAVSIDNSFLGYIALHNGDGIFIPFIY